ncbi:MAG: hypothetical protein LBC19_08205 [Tannerella sp.]|jgi:hypothetical protein|nr:hypothetical protein [Tannerella sp.]
MRTSKTFIFLIPFFISGLTAFAQDNRRYLQEAVNCFDAGDYDCAKRRYEAYRATGGKNDVSKRIGDTETCLKLSIIANEYFNKKDYEEAAKQYAAILDVNPKDRHASDRKNRITVITGKQYVRYNDGYYFGAIRNGTRNGSGKYCWNNGDVYDGDWVNGKQHGRGTARFGGEVYKGEWKDGEPAGKITHYHASGSTETGTIVNGTFVREQAFAGQKTKKSEYKSSATILGYMFSPTAPVGFIIGRTGDRFGGYASYKAALIGKEEQISETDAEEIDYDKYDHYRWAVTGGGILRTFGDCYLYAGLGYGKYGKAYKATPAYYTDAEKYYVPEIKSGLNIDCGLMYSFSNWYISAGYNSVLLSQPVHDFSIGIGMFIR